MRIHDDRNDKQLSSITLYLTPAEASELADGARDLSENPDKHHFHIPGENYEKEVTLAVYTPTNLDQFDEKSRRVIEGK